jgi:putative membrane protein
MIRVVLAVLHLLALAIGMSSIDARTRALRRVQRSPDALRDVFIADAWWGAAGAIWIVTGLWRWLGGMEKTPAYYAGNHIFYAKMALLGVVLALEISPIVTISRWRLASRRGTLPPAEELALPARRLARMSRAQSIVVIVMLVTAVLIARGYGGTT